MGGIAGIIRFDGQTVAPGDITRISQLLKHRGDLITQHVDGGVLLAFTGNREADDITGMCAVADADLFADTAVNQPFLVPYRQQGPASFNDLNADFAVAIWDARQQTLCCARDPLGVKPLYYVHQPGRFFAFASEIKALLALGEVTTAANQHVFREYLTWTTNYVPYSAETFYENVYSLLPGHSLRVTAGESVLEPYWTINLLKFSELTPADDYAGLFRDSFTTAIDTRMRGKSRIGAHLSGGLDSSSVSCVAQHLLTQQHRPRLHTFNVDTGLSSTDESVYVQAVLNQYHPQHHTVRPLTDVLDSALNINHLFDRPEQFIVSSGFHLSVALDAQRQGCDCLLTGHDGDSVVTTGFEYIDQLIDQSDWEHLYAACQQFIAYPDHNRLYGNDGEQLEQYALHTLGAEVTKRFRHQPLGMFLKTLRTQKHLFGISTGAIMVYCFTRIRDKLSHNKLIDNALSADFKQRVPVRSAVSTKAFTDRIAAEQGISLNQILNKTNVICNEQLNHIGAYHGHQYSFPFFDKQVIEIGLATPLPVRFDHGRGRGLIRNGLQNRLPAAILSRLTKANFVEYGTLSTQQLYNATREQFAAPGHPIWAVIDRTVLAEIVATVFNSRIPVRKKTRYNWMLSRIIYLALWLGSLKTTKSLSG